MMFRNKHKYTSQSFLHTTTSETTQKRGELQIQMKVNDFIMIMCIQLDKFHLKKI